MSRERQLEGDGIEELAIGDQVEEEEELEEEEEEGEGEGEEDADRGDEHVDDDDAAGEEEAEEEEAETAPVARTAPKTVPYARFAEVHAQNQQLAQAISLLANGQGAAATKTEATPAAPAFDFTAKARERNKALLDGDEDKAAELDAEIMKQQRLEAQREAESRVDAIVNAKLEKTAMDSIVAVAFEQYPFLSSEDPSYNAEALDEVLALKSHYMQSMTASDALAKAIGKVCPRYAEEMDDDAPAARLAKKPVTPAAPAVPAKKGDAMRLSAQAAAKLRNARLSNKQPAALNQGGISNRTTVDVSKLDPSKMTDEELAALPPDVKKKMRGDTLTAS